MDMGSGNRRRMKVMEAVAGLDFLGLGHCWRLLTNNYEL
jgi:hypothetical protein